MKWHSDNLFTLIKSLTKSEKRYLKLYMNIYKGDSNYLKVFEAIEKQEVYNEHELRLIFKQEKFVTRFNEVKTYVFDSILKGLRSYNTEISIDTHINSFIHNITILFEKGLFKLCLEEIQKTKKIAYKFERYALCYELLRWELSIPIGIDGKPKNKQHQLKLLHEQKNIFKLFSAIFSISSLREMIYLLPSKDPRLIEEKEVLKKNGLDKNSATTQLNILRLHFYNEHSKNNINAAYSYLKKIEALYHKFTHLQTTHVRFYAETLHNLIFIAFENWFEKDIKKYIDSITLIKNKTPFWIERSLSMSYLFRLIFHINIAEVGQAIKLIEFNSQKNNDPKIFPVYRSSIIIYSSLAYFAAKNYRQSLRQVNLFLEFSTKNTTTIHPDSITIMSILQIIIHLEMENHALVKILVNRMKKDIELGKIVFHFDKTILDSFLKLVNKNRILEQKKIFFALEKVLVEWNVKPYTQKFIPPKEFILIWVRSKLNKISYEKELINRQKKLKAI